MTESEDEEDEEDDEDEVQRCWNCGANYHGRCEKKKTTCGTCGIKGHMTKYHEEYVKFKNAKNTRKGKKHTVAATAVIEEDHNDCSDDFLYHWLP